MLSAPQLLESPVAPEVLYGEMMSSSFRVLVLKFTSAAALDVAGAAARDIWGVQWIKLLGVLYEGVTTGLFGQEGRLIGGKTAEGTAARVRVQLEIERIMGASQ